MKASAAGHRGDDRDGLAVGHRRVEPLEEADVVVGHEDVHEAAQAAVVVEQAVGEAGVRRPRGSRGPRRRCALDGTSVAPPVRVRSVVGTRTVTVMRGSSGRPGVDRRSASGAGPRPPDRLPVEGTVRRLRRCIAPCGGPSSDLRVTSTPTRSRGARRARRSRSCCRRSDEAATVGDHRAQIRAELMERVRARSTRSSWSTTARPTPPPRWPQAAGARVVAADDVLPELGPGTGKGEALWKSVCAGRGRPHRVVRRRHPRLRPPLRGRSARPAAHRAPTSGS